MSKLQNIVGLALREWFPNEEIIENWRPDFLLGMEVDFYIPNLRLVIEVQGHQHRLFCPNLQTLDEFHAQRARDKQKRIILRENRFIFLSSNANSQAIGGLQTSISKHFHKNFQTSKVVRGQWYGHCNFLNTNGKYVKFKITRSRGIVPVDKKSSRFLKKNPILGQKNPSHYIG